MDLFEKPEYLLQLYRVLHPEDTESTEDDLTIVTLESLLLRDRYNDLGFMVSNRLMILVEAQSTWSVNILIRFLLYVADTYNRYIEKNELDLYGSRNVELPRPELYVIYTGGLKSCPDTISLRGDVFGTDASNVEITATVLRDSKQGDILNQYIAFTRVFDEQISKHGKTRKAVLETLRICRDDNILRDYLKNEEVADIMFTLVDREKQLNLLLAREREQNKAEGRAEGRAEGVAEGRAEGRAEGIAEGRAEGHAEGLARIKKLYAALKQDSRLDDYDRAMEDDEMFEQLAAEYGI